MDLSEYIPIPALVTRHTHVAKPRFPVMDAHCHLGVDFGGGWDQRPVGDLLERCPNFYIDISARTAELGRQPYTARRFFLQHADRILFGSDMAANVAGYQLYYRFLETNDEYFPYSTSRFPPQGRWNIYGLFLPDEVLARVYYQNAQRVILNRGE